jgi:D-alanyl-D-alanine carboxypeptidase
MSQPRSSGLFLKGSPRIFHSPFFSTRSWLVFLAAAFFLALSQKTFARVEPADILIDAGSGRIVAAHRANAQWRPASLTKVMTLYVIFGDLRAGRLSLTDRVILSARAVGQSTNSTGLPVCARLSIEEAIAATILISANDAASALAELAGGSEERFAERMNEAAARIGMNRSHFANATGLPNQGQISTAHDLALLAYRLRTDFPDYYMYFARREARLGRQVIRTINPMLANYPGAEGMKTGFTCASGYNLIGSAHRGERRLIGVVLGGTDPTERLGRMRQLLNKGFTETGGEAHPNIADPITTASDEQDSPPDILGHAGCAEGAGGTIRGTSSWAAILGSFPTGGLAQKFLSDLKSRAGHALAREPRIVRRAFEGETRHDLVVSGLSQTDAGNFCKTLWARNIYCLALAPAVVNNPKADWR